MDCLVHPLGSTHSILDTTALQDSIFLGIFYMPANKSRNQHLNLLSPFHEVFSHFLLTYLSTSILRGHCPGSLWKAICTLGLNDSTGKSDLMRFLVVGPVTCASRTLSKSSGILKVVTKRQREVNIWNHQTSLYSIFTHTGALCYLLGYLQKLLH